MDKYKDNVVGAKSKNLAAIRAKVPDSIALPASVSITFGSFEKAMESRDNKQVA